MWADRVPVVLAGALLFGLGAFAGAWGGARFERSERAERVESMAPGDVADDSGELASAVGELRSVVASLRDAVDALRAERGAAAETPRVALAPTGAAPQGDELVRTLRELTAAVDALRESRRESRAAQPLEPSRAELAAALRLPELRDAVRAKDTTTFRAVREQILSKVGAWTYDDVLAAYGRPDAMMGNESFVTWSYDFAGDGGREENFCFQFVDGRVCSVDLRWVGR